jgi:hypothetical protein
VSETIFIASEEDLLPIRRPARKPVVHPPKIRLLVNDPAFGCRNIDDGDLSFLKARQQMCENDSLPIG